MRAAAAILVVGFALSAAQPTACARSDLRREALLSLVDERRSFLGDPGPSIAAAGKLRDDPRAAIYPHDLSIGSAFIYPPIAARPYAPLAGQRPSLVRASLSKVSRALFVVVVALLVALLTVRRRPRVLELVAAVLGALAFFPLVHAVQLNQATLAVTALVGVAFVGLVVERPVLAGLALGVACAVKPHLVLVLPLLVFHARRAVFAALAAGAALLTLSLVYAGVHNHVVYATSVLPTLSRGYAYFANQSANGLYQRLFIDSDIGVFVLPPAYLPVQALTLGTAVAGYAAAVFVVHRARARADLAPLVLAFAWLVGTLISPIGWQHHFAPALFVFALLRRDRTVSTPLAALSFVLLGAYFEVRQLRDPFALLGASHVFFGGLLLAALLGRALLTACADTRGTARSGS